MMNVSEYASDVGRTVEEILRLCQKLSISASTSEDMLSDDDIIMLDNELASIDEIEESYDEENSEVISDQLEENYEEEL